MMLRARRDDEANRQEAVLLKLLLDTIHGVPWAKHWGVHQTALCQPHHSHVAEPAERLGLSWVRMQAIPSQFFRVDQVLVPCLVLPLRGHVCRLGCRSCCGEDEVPSQFMFAWPEHQLFCQNALSHVDEPWPGLEHIGCDLREGPLGRLLFSSLGWTTTGVAVLQMVSQLSQRGGLALLLQCTTYGSKKTDRCHRRAEEGVRDVRTRIVARHACGGHAISKRDDVEASFASLAHGGLHAAIRHESRQGDRLHAARLQLLQEISARECRETALALYQDVHLCHGLDFVTHLLRPPRCPILLCPALRPERGTKLSTPRASHK
mmetsp:Transcript_96242/g.241246  ORF Transcript_96242/g.241246 Transcript_96242/m.241246 type:complete len:320 (-) Transcript_96242:484-1443(-)